MRRLTIKAQADSAQDLLGQIQLLDSNGIDQAGSMGVSFAGNQVTVDFANLVGGEYRLRLVQKLAAQGGMPGAYTIFANAGVNANRYLNLLGCLNCHIRPQFISS